MSRRDFIRNNIGFRIIACKAIESYKNAQAFVLSNIIEGKHKFTDTPKELILLMFDNWFRYSMFLERFCLARLLQEFTDDDAKKISLEAQFTMDNITDIVISNNIFESSFVNVWRRTHKYLDDYLFLCFEQQTGNRAQQVFPNILSTLCKYLNSSLFELHEIDCLLQEQRIILSLDPVCIEYDVSTNKVLLAERYEVYRQIYDSPVDIKVYVKDLDTRLLCEEHCIKPITALGASIAQVEY